MLWGAEKMVLAEYWCPYGSITILVLSVGKRVFIDQPQKRGIHWISRHPLCGGTLKGNQASLTGNILYPFFFFFLFFYKTLTHWRLKSPVYSGWGLWEMHVKATSNRLQQINQIRINPFRTYVWLLEWGMNISFYATWSLVFSAHKKLAIYKLLFLRARINSSSLSLPQNWPVCSQQWTALYWGAVIAEWSKHHCRLRTSILEVPA